MPTYGWLVDPKRCIECRACESACKQWNGVETGLNVRYRKVNVREAGTFPAPRSTWRKSTRVCSSIRWALPARRGSPCMATSRN